jgi:acetylornithine deacetylase/succinyl-diaminopimelate desuccinylase-like protein
VRPVPAWERAEVRKLGQSEAAYRKFLGVPAFRTPRGATPFEAVRFHPTLEFNGIGGGYQGEGSKTVIPSVAKAKISCRLVPDMRPAEIARLVERTLRARAPKGVRVNVIQGHTGEPYVVVPPDRPNTPKNQRPALARAFRAAHAGVKEVFGKPPLYLREGGSVPIIAAIQRELGLDCVLLGLFLPEDNLHAPDESFHLGMLEKGMAVSRRILEGAAG